MVAKYFIAQSFNSSRRCCVLLKTYFFALCVLVERKVVMGAERLGNFVFHEDDSRS